MRKEILDLHCHTIASGHAYSTLKENIEEAEKNGIKYLGISDHAPKMPGGPNSYFFNNLHVVPKDINGIKVLKGIEANIFDYDGSIDVDEGMIKHLDYVIASFHIPCISPGSLKENTKSALKVMEKPKVKIMGHLDDGRYPVDFEEITKKAKECNVLLELNNSSLAPNSYRVGTWENAETMLKYCIKYDVKVIFGSDAHICYSIGDFKYSKEVAKRVNFPEELIINYHEKEINEFFNL